MEMSNQDSEGFSISIPRRLESLSKLLAVYAVIIPSVAFCGMVCAVAYSLNGPAVIAAVRGTKPDGPDRSGEA